MSHAWVPLVGQFEEQKGKLVFEGKVVEYVTENEPRTFLSIGNALASTRFSGGSVSATVEFEEVESRSGCELILYYEPGTQWMVTAGIGGGSGMFSIRHFDGKQWTFHRDAGDRSNIKPKRKYALKATVRGSRVVLNVDGVDVNTVDLPYRLPESQVGIWCMSSNRVTVSDFTVTTQQPKAFVVMQFSSPYNEVYQDVIRIICDEFHVEVIRADEEYGPGIIIADVSKQIVESKFVVADITPANPNVYYEVGYAHALNKPTILIAEKGTKLPFDVSPFRTLLYENTINGKAKLEDGLRKHIRAILTQA